MTDHQHNRSRAVELDVVRVRDDAESAPDAAILGAAEELRHLGLDVAVRPDSLRPSPSAHRVTPCGGERHSEKPNRGKMSRHAGAAGLSMQSASPFLVALAPR